MVTTLKGVRLFLNVGKGTPRPASYDMMTALSRVQVTDGIEEQDGGFEITFTLGRQKAKDYALVEGDLCQPDTRVVIGVFLNGSRETLISGVVTFFQLQPSNQPGMSTLSVMGRSISDMMDRKEKSVSHPNLSDSGIVRKLLGDYGQYGIRIQQIKETEDTPHENQFLARQRGTDLQLIQVLAKRNAHVFYVTPTPSGDGSSNAYWGPENRDATPLPALTMNMGYFTNVTNLSFFQDTQAAVDAKATFFDPEQKRSSDIAPESEDSKEISLASTPAPRLRTVLLSGTAKYNEKQVAIAGRAAMTPNLAAVKGQGELDTTLYPHILKVGKVVGVRGAGSFYDGDYYIEQVTHSIERGKYTQNFQVARNGVGTRKQKVS
jgi:hypothetical protein